MVKLIFTALFSLLLNQSLSQGCFCLYDDGQQYVCEQMNCGNGQSDCNALNGEWFSGDSSSDLCDEALPVELLYFEVTYKDGVNIISWTTATETNNWKFELQRLYGGEWATIKGLSGAGNSVELIRYEVQDRNPPLLINYYRLIQYDYDGRKSVFDIVSVDNRKLIVKRVNLMGKSVTSNYRGIVIVIYSDGTTEKVLQ